MFQMFPMTLFEFANAIGIGDNIIQYLEKCFNELTPVDEIIHKRMLNTFYYHLICGGCLQLLINLLKREIYEKYVMSNKISFTNIKQIL